MKLFEFGIDETVATVEIDEIDAIDGTFLQLIENIFAIDGIAWNVGSDARDE